MVMVPAFVWRGGFLRRVLTVALFVGLFFGLQAWLDSGMAIAGAIVLVLVGGGFGIFIALRMRRYWPGARELTGAQRVAVVTAVRRGERIEDDALAPAVLDYSRALHSAAEKGRPLRWVIVIALVVGLATTLWDAVFGSWGNAAASVIYLAVILGELFWWPKREAALLTNADRAAAMVETS
ncbi:hypothetical protein BH09ACT7_BH09ACT7_57690 [soil metagenome]